MEERRHRRRRFRHRHVFHPNERGLAYARTDVGGAYRWDDEAQRWIAMTDWIGAEDENLIGIESLAIDPSDPERVYLAAGTYTNPKVGNGAILRSSDRGRTFQRTDLPFKLGGNEMGRGNGERAGGRSQRRPRAVLRLARRGTVAQRRWWRAAGRR